jgi:hypothetical protein
MNKEDALNGDRKPVILLTGCINPMGMSFTKLQNPDIRRVQYIDAIKFYLKTTDNVIVFVENSGNDISGEFDQQDRLEIITFSGNNYDNVLGKGYGEMLILKYAFENSSFIKRNSSICKITGRYKVLNVNRILQSYSKSDCNVMVDLPKRMKYADSRIFIADKPFFINFLFKNLDLINDSEGVYFEHALNKAVLQSIIENYSYLPLKYRARIIGQSGSDNYDYDHSFSDWFPHNIRKIISFKLFSRGLKYP